MWAKFVLSLRSEHLDVYLWDCRADPNSVSLLPHTGCGELGRVRTATKCVLSFFVRLSHLVGRRAYF